MITELPEERIEFLADIVTTAVEGGINDWAAIDGYYSANARIHLLDDESQTHVAHIDINTVDLGIYRIVDHRLKIRDEIRKTITVANVTLDASEIDAEAADCIIQAGLFGALVYG